MKIILSFHYQIVNINIRHFLKHLPPSTYRFFLPLIKTIDHVMRYIQKYFSHEKNYICSFLHPNNGDNCLWTEKDD